MTGDISFATSARISSFNGDYKGIDVRSAQDTSGGAFLGLYTSDSKNASGGFSLHARDGTNMCGLNGTPDGTLKWGGNHVLRIVSQEWTWEFYTIRYSNGIQEVFATVYEIFNGNTRTFPIPFASGSYVNAIAVDVGDGTVNVGIEANATSFKVYVKNSDGSYRGSASSLNVRFIGFWK